MTTGKLLAIAIRRASRAPMEEFDAIEITTEAGLTNDFRGKPSNRQVTVLAREDWDAACAEVEDEVAWTTRRANLLVEGLSLTQQVGATIHIGDVVLEVTGETDPCYRMDEQCSGLQGALTPDWRGGVTCRVRHSGAISIGDAVEMKSLLPQ